MRRAWKAGGNNNSEAKKLGAKQRKWKEKRYAEERMRKNDGAKELWERNWPKSIFTYNASRTNRDYSIERSQLMRKLRGNSWSMIVNSPLEKSDFSLLTNSIRICINLFNCTSSMSKFVLSNPLSNFSLNVMTASRWGIYEPHPVHSTFS
jgi:hypothetical protein